MKIELQRYYGDDKVTKSKMSVYMQDSNEPVLLCEARETCYLSYTDSFPGQTKFCLPLGTLFATVRPTRHSPMTIAVGRTSRSSKTIFCASLRQIPPTKHIHIGYANDSQPPEIRRLTRQSDCLAHLTRLAYQAWSNNEPISVEVKDIQ